MKSEFKTLIMVAFLLTLSSFVEQKEETFSLTIEVKGLRNSKGVVKFALYNKDGTIPDEDYINYYKVLNGEINNNVSVISFHNLPPGKYAVNILHDENQNGKIDKGFILPIEGIGFSNFKTIGFGNRPTFSKAKFELKENKTVQVKVIYM